MRHCTQRPVAALRDATRGGGSGTDCMCAGMGRAGRRGVLSSVRGRGRSALGAVPRLLRLARELFVPSAPMTSEPTMTPFVSWPPADDNLVLLRALVGGNGAALEPLYRRLAPAVYRYCLGLCGDPALAADATHDAFTALAEKPHGFDPHLGTPGAWLAGIARHALLARHRRFATEVAHESAHAGDDDEGIDEHCASPEQLLVQRQALAQLQAALRTLPWVLREALVLVDLQERPYAEAAQIAGCELNTLRSRLHRARLRLASLLTATTGALP